MKIQTKGVTFQKGKAFFNSLINLNKARSESDCIFVF